MIINLTASAVRAAHRVEHEEIGNGNCSVRINVENGAVHEFLDSLPSERRDEQNAEMNEFAEFAAQEVVKR